MNTTLKKHTTLRLDMGLYAYLEFLAKQENRSFNNFIENLLSRTVSYEPNAETKKAIAEAIKEKPQLKRYTNIDDLLNDLKDV